MTDQTHFPETRAAFRRLRRAWREVWMLRALQRAQRHAEILGHPEAEYLICLAILAPLAPEKNVEGQGE